MQIIAELDSQHVEKLHLLEKSLKKTTSELIAFAIDEVFTKAPNPSEGQSAYQLMLQSGFIACMEDGADLSENYKDYLNWGDKV